MTGGSSVVVSQEIGRRVDKWDAALNKVRLAKIVTTHFQENIYILELADPVKNALVLPVRSTLPQYGEPIIGIGYADGRLHFGYGHYQGIANTDNENVELVGKPVIEMDGSKNRLVLDSGASGGPIIDCREHIFGLTSQVISNDLMRMTQDGANVHVELWRLGTKPGTPTNAIVPATALFGETLRR